MTRETIDNEDRGVSLKSVKHVLYDVCLHEDNRALFSKLLERVNKLRDWEEYMAIKKQSSGDLISRQAVNNLQKYRYNCGDTSITCISLKSVNDLPSVKPQPCEDAISRQAVLSKKIYTETEEGWSGYTVDADYIEHLPSVKPQEKTGHWIIIDDCEHFLAECSECGEVVDSRMINDYPYCHCGAKMD